MRRRWTEKEIWDWYMSHEWISGFNLVPSTSLGGMLYVLQEYDHENAFRQTAKEIALAASLKLNSIRAGLPFYLWLKQRDIFFKNLDQFLELLDSYGMTMMPVLFSDCIVPKSQYREPVLGPQPEPVKGYFGGTDQNAFDEKIQAGENIGYSIVDEPEMEPVIKQYVSDLAEHYGKDPRILIWNIWNEIGNSGRDAMSLPMMRQIFAWLREADVSQPLTSDMWGAQVQGETYYAWLNDPHIFGEVDRESIELSDIITFHFYGDYYHTKQLIQYLRQFNRPLINTEWMHRPLGSFMETHLPLWKKEKIGSYFFGFVNGKPQMNVVWDFIKPYASVDQKLWMHDIFHSDFTPYDKDEIAVLKACNENKKIWEQKQ